MQNCVLFVTFPSYKATSKQHICMGCRSLEQVSVPLTINLFCPIRIFFKNGPETRRLVILRFRFSLGTVARLFRIMEICCLHLPQSSFKDIRLAQNALSPTRGYDRAGSDITYIGHHFEKSPTKSIFLLENNSLCCAKDRVYHTRKHNQ